MNEQETSELEQRNAETGAKLVRWAKISFGLLLAAVIAVIVGLFVRCSSAGGELTVESVTSSDTSVDSK